MAEHYLTTRQAKRIGRVLREVERSRFTSPQVGRELESFQIMVRADEDITPEHSSDCVLLKGQMGAFNAVVENGATVTVEVWNLGQSTIVDGAEFPAQWTISEGSNGAWVALQDQAKTDPVSRPNLYRAVVIESGGIADGGTGDIRVNQETKTGKWQHATSGLDLLVDGEIWAWGPLPDGTYDIVGADCRFVS